MKWVCLLALYVTSPLYADFDWQTADTATQHVSKEKVDALRDVMAKHGTKALLIIRHDKIVYEWYAKDVTADTKQGTASMAKAVVGGMSLAVAMQDHLVKILIAISEGKGEEAADIVIQMSETTPSFDLHAFRKAISGIVVERKGQALQQINVGATLLNTTRIAADQGLHVPSELTMLGKTLLQLDEVGRILDPKFDPDAAIRRNVTAIMTKRFTRDTSKGSIFSALLDVKQFVSGLPVRLNRIMDAVASKDLEVKVRAVDAPIIMEGLQKIANRVTSGLILAALIIGAALLMRVDTPFKIAGYPGLAIVCFLAATAGGVWLLLNIFWQDRRAARS